MSDEEAMETSWKTDWKAAGQDDQAAACSHQGVGWMMVLTRRKSAAYWEGWQAVQTRQSCRYTENRDRGDWARGFADGVDEDRGSKVWYKSKTMIVGLVLLVFGVGVVLYGTVGGGGQVFTGFGSGVGGSSLLMTEAHHRNKCFVFRRRWSIHPAAVFLDTWESVVRQVKELTPGVCNERHRGISWMFAGVFSFLSLLVGMTGWSIVNSNVALSEVRIEKIKNEEIRNYTRLDTVDLKVWMKSVSEKQDRMDAALQRLVVIQEQEKEKSRP